MDDKRLVSWEVRPEVLGAVMAFVLFAAISRSGLVEFILRWFLSRGEIGERRAPALSGSSR